MASEAYRDWSGEAAGARLRVNFMLKLLLSQNFSNQPLMRFVSFAPNIGPAAAVPAGPAPAPLRRSTRSFNNARVVTQLPEYGCQFSENQEISCTKEGTMYGVAGPSSGSS